MNVTLHRHRPNGSSESTLPLLKASTVTYALKVLVTQSSASGPIIRMTNPSWSLRLHRRESGSVRP